MRRRAQSQIPGQGQRSAAPDERAVAPGRNGGDAAAVDPAFAASTAADRLDIPFSVDIDLAPLLAASQTPLQSDGGWWSLRERFAHLGLAQGFDELLCLPHLRGVETFWYQVETVRKVLKQFRGRVLLADEVGLGKTIEAGMVLKEYLLRGMVDSVLARLRHRWSGSGGRSSRPSLTSSAPPPMTRSYAATWSGSGSRSA